MHWILKEKPDPEKVHHMSKSLDIDMQLAGMLVQRGIDNFDKAREFFRPDLKQLHDPFLMKDMDRAVNRLSEAIEAGENILIYGDYDVDGTTAVSLVYAFLQPFYPQVATYIPDRYEEGYGLSYQGIDFARDNGVSLIIALDCGIKAVDKVAYAKQHGIDLIICDHHRPGDELPEAAAVLDPKRPDCNYPYNELCGCGVGFKFMQAFVETKGMAFEELIPLLDLVAIAIAADIVPITGENRVLAHYGLQVINTSPRTGIRAMTQHLKKDLLNITDVVFQVAPKINAAGRMKHGLFAVELLTEKEPSKASALAAMIDQHNSDRKEFDKKMTREALEQIEANKEQKCFTTVVFQEDWHKGVIGIVASRLIEKYYRPTLVFTRSGDKLAASARSVRGFDVYNALEQCADLIEQFGGHKYAAGLTLEPENYAAFKAKFEKVVAESIEQDSLEPRIDIDAEVSLSDLNPKFYRILKQFGPFGPQNMKPVFMATGLRDNGYGKKVGQDGSHLKLCLMAGSDRNTFDAIGFGLGDKYELTKNGRPLKAVFTLEANTWNGMSKLQLNLKDLKED